MQDNYYRKYDLVRDPFPIGSVDGIIHLTPQLGHRLEQIKGLITDSQKLIIVTSAAGAGKTVLSEHLETLKEPDWMVSYVRGNTSMQSESLAHEIIQGLFPDKSFDPSQSINELHKFLESAARNERLPVFIIDDAHKLSLDLLEFILQLSELRYNEILFRFVLFGDEILNDHLNDPKLTALTYGKTENIYLPSLSHKQTKAYIDNRLSLCGEYNQYPFTDEDIQKIYTVSGGLPKGINILARQVMEKGGKPVEKQTSKSMVAGISAAILLIVIAGGYIFLNYFGEKQSLEISSKVSVTMPPEKPLADIQTARDTGYPRHPEPAAETIYDEPVKIDQAAVSEPEQIISETELEGAEPEVLVPALSQEAEASIQKVIKTEETSEKSVAQPIEQSPSIPEEPMAMVQEESISGEEDENIFNLKSIPEYLSGIRGRNWFQQQSDDAYSLQLISASRIENIEDMVGNFSDETNQLSGYVKYTPSWKPRYLLFYGVYDDWASADAATKTLHTKIKSVQPWPRKISSIVKEINEVTARGMPPDN